MDVHAVSWDTRVYAGIRQFHQARGFDPHSQEVAAALGYPLVYVHCEEDAQLADMHENYPDDHCSDSDSDSDSVWGDEKSELDGSVNEDSLRGQEGDIYAARRSSSAQEIVSENEENFRLSNDLDEIDEQYVVNTSIVWGASIGAPSSWNNNCWR
ncbi:hypothetical protein B0H13DRAFT_2143244 [Mycena leptocephala]|nr:hypothetical protein B0H13DRAFT_2143244 [Mycena leptocephala]